MPILDTIHSVLKMSSSSKTLRRTSFLTELIWSRQYRNSTKEGDLYVSLADRRLDANLGYVNDAEFAALLEIRDTLVRERDGLTQISCNGSLLNSCVVDSAMKYKLEARKWYELVQMVMSGSRKRQNTIEEAPVLDPSSPCSTTYPEENIIREDREISVPATSPTVPLRRSINPVSLSPEPISPSPLSESVRGERDENTVDYAASISSESDSSDVDATFNSVAYSETYIHTSSPYSDSDGKLQDGLDFDLSAFDSVFNAYLEDYYCDVHTISAKHSAMSPSYAPLITTKSLVPEYDICEADEDDSVFFEMSSDFLIWLNVNLQHLHEGVSTQVVMERLLSFPPGEIDYESMKELMEYIRSNSDLDAHEFVHEFARRRETFYAYQQLCAPRIPPDASPDALPIKNHNGADLHRFSSAGLEAMTVDTESGEDSPVLGQCPPLSSPVVRLFDAMRSDGCHFVPRKEHTDDPEDEGYESIDAASVVVEPRTSRSNTLDVLS
ncbi:hypothetical protein K474DRAFT_1655882 [Panus rudis PR-1116 ss-1]|nr:hypothetical protein K474DRAFT_1655882 [Panus rudis PR-1116 ss-1]